MADVINKSIYSKPYIFEKLVYSLVTNNLSNTNNLEMIKI